LGRPRGRERTRSGTPTQNIEQGKNDRMRKDQNWLRIAKLISGLRTGRKASRAVTRLGRGVCGGQLEVTKNWAWEKTGVAWGRM